MMIRIFWSCRLHYIIHIYYIQQACQTQVYINWAKNIKSLLCGPHIQIY